MQLKEGHRPTSRVLDILELLAANPEGLTMTEIAEGIQAPKSTIFPIIHTMSERKFIFLNKSSSKYMIGIGSFCVGEAYASNQNVLQFINKEMHHIVENVGEICQMGILDGGEVLYVEKVDSKEAIRLESHVGKRLPAYCTALGKALLSGHSIEEIQKIYPEGLTAYTPNTIATFEKLEKELEEVRRTNIAKEHEEITDYIVCVAVPLEAENKRIAALSVSIPSFRASLEKEDMAAAFLLRAKRKIELYFGTIHFDISDFIF